MPSLMAYLATIAKASARYKWPSWVAYDLYIRQEAADSSNTDWSRIDQGLYAECFSGMAITEEGWCIHCYSTEHPSDSCLLKPGARNRQLLQHLSSLQLSVKQASLSARNLTSLMAIAASETHANSYMHASIANRHPRTQCPRNQGR